MNNDTSSVSKIKLLLWGIGCGLPLLILSWLIYFLVSPLDNAPQHYSAITPTQQMAWGELYIWMRIPYSANFQREELEDFYETNILIEAKPKSNTVDENCFLKPQHIKIKETKYDKTLIDQKVIWGSERGKGMELYSDRNNQLGLYSMNFDISPDYENFNAHFKYEIICEEGVNVYDFEQNFSRKIGSNVNFHVR